MGVAAVLVARADVTALRTGRVPLGGVGWWQLGPGVTNREPLIVVFLVHLFLQSLIPNVTISATNS